MLMTKSEAASLQFLLNSMKQAIFVYDVASSQFSFLNPAFEQTFKITQNSALNPNALLLMVHEEDRPFIIKMCSLLMKQINIEAIEFRLLLPEQGERWVCLTPFWMDDLPEQPRIVGYLEDITAAKQHDEYMKKFSSKKNSVLHILAHDLAGPLAMIQNLSAEITHGLKVYGNESLNDLVSLIEKTSQHGTALIKNVTNQEFLETIGVALSKTRVNLSQRLKEVIAQYQQSEKKIAKVFRFIPASREIYLNIDDLKLMQAVNNLLSNAIKFTPAGGVITLSLEEHTETVLLKVEDNGIGIPHEYQESLFDKFTPARRPGLQGEPTTGLGLSITKAIVEWHLGKIWFVSHEGQGTVFYIELPKK